MALAGVKGGLLGGFRTSLGCRGLFCGFRASLGFRVLYWGSFYLFLVYFLCTRVAPLCAFDMQLYLSGKKK